MLDATPAPTGYDLSDGAMPQQQPVASTSAPKSSRAEIKRDSVGVSEKLRRHAGNIPVLPQTKQCPHCPAKFTRSTHLNRHLKTHSSERLHKCEACQSEFTRTDLLSRHKKTCNGISRSRRKSCVPCSESKIKCDLTYPCAKCQARGKECIIAGTKRRGAGPAPIPVAEHSSGGGLTPPAEAAPGASPKSTPSEGAGISSGPEAWRNAYEPSVTESMTDELGTALSYETGTSQAGAPSLGSMYAGNPGVFDGLFSGIFASPAALEPAPNAALAWAGGGHEYAAQYAGAGGLSSLGVGQAYGAASAPPSAAGAVGAASSTVPTPQPAPSYTDLILSFGEFNGAHPQQPVQSVPVMHPPLARVSPPLPMHGRYGGETYASDEATAGELDNYTYLFFTVFSPQMPLLHGPTWTPEGKPAILLAAMRAAGALYVRTQRAAIFILQTLNMAREILVSEFAKDLSNAVDRTHLILATALLQAVGLFHQQPEVRASHNIFHGMLVQTVRRRGLIDENAAWAVPELKDAASVEIAWQEWAVHETVKRAILLSWVHDCCHVLYFGLPSSFIASEFTLNLPVEDALWRATSSIEWFQELQKPSPFGPLYIRVLGYPFQKALIALSDSRKLETLTARALINAHSHWILIHTVLRNLYALCPPADPNTMYADWKKRIRASRDPEDRGRQDALPPDGVVGDEVLKVQYVLHNWLTSWLRAPEVENVDGPDGRELPFMADALPFYWLAQVSLMALQEGMPPFATGVRTDADARFRLVKHWLRHVRHFLRAGSRQPTLLWNEMMKIRLQDWQGGPPEDQDGLLGFFPELP